MDKFSYNSYPDSAESSPRSRDVEFENPQPWDDNNQHQHQHQQSYKVKLMCSYGGKIQPRPHDNQLTYVNGDTKIMSVDRGIRFPTLVSKLSAVCGGGGGGGDGGGEISFKYQLPGEDLDALISVTSDEDLEHMMHEYDRLVRLSSKPARMRLFLFPSSPISGGFGSQGSTKSDRDTLKPIPSRPESEKSVTAAEYLFGSEKVAPVSPSPVKVPQPVPEPVVHEPPQMFVDQRMLQPDHGVNPAEIQRQIQDFQRIQIRDQEQQQQQMLHQNQLQLQLHHQQQQEQEAIHQNQLLQQQQQQQQQQHEAIHQNQLLQQQQQQEAIHQNQLLQQQQQQEAMYRRKSEEEAGRYFSPTYAQNPAPATNPQPPVGYWQGNSNNNMPGNVYTTTSQNLPEQQQVYMIPAQSQAPGTVYQSVMRPPTVQRNQGYYTPGQRIQHPDACMEQQNQQGYNVVQPQPPYSQVMTSVGPPMGSQEQYSQMGKAVYYTVAGEGMMAQPPPPQQQQQYQGMGQPVSGMTDLRTGPDGKVTVNNAAPKVSDSV